MPKEQGMSKRQMLREKRQRDEQRKRMISIGVVILGALFVAGLFIRELTPKPPEEFITITPGVFPQPDMNAMGDPNAPVKLEVWEDFQCPACKNFSTNIETLLIQNYVATGKVYYVFHHFPFIDNYADAKESDQAANASMCAGEQGRFWDFKEILYANWNGENLGAFTDRRLTAFADSLGLDMEAFKKCFNDNRYADQIEKDSADGEELGVNSTPSIFVNRRMVLNAENENYVPTYEDIAAAIEAALVK